MEALSTYLILSGYLAPGEALLLKKLFDAPLKRSKVIKFIKTAGFSDFEKIISGLQTKQLIKSDNEIYFISNWGNCSRSENHELRWELYNKNGDKVYNTVRRNVKIRPHIFYSTKIFLDKSIKDSLIPGMYTVKLYFDGDLVKTKSGKYVPKSILNKNVNSAVILPFNDTSIETNIKVNNKNYE